MATSHYCNGEWRDGPVESCSHHKRLSKKQTNVYKGVGEPGGRGGQPQPSEPGSGAGESSSGGESAGASGKSGSKS